MRNTSGYLCSGTFEFKQDNVFHLVSCFSLKILLALKYLCQEPLSSHENFGYLREEFLVPIFSSSEKSYSAERGSAHQITMKFSVVPRGLMASVTN